VDRDPAPRVPLAHRERVEEHVHVEQQLIYPRRGVLRVATPLGVWAVPPLRAVWIPAGVVHGHEAYGETDLRCLMFGREINPLSVDRPTVLGVTPLLGEIIATLTDDRNLPDDHRRTLERAALDQLHRVEPLNVHLPAPEDPRLRDVTELLRADPSDGRSLAELGAAVGASERTLSRLFRAQTGMTFPQWRTQLRLHHSLTLLAGGTSVTTTATDCGYNGPSAFIHAFRTAFGTTPGDHLAVR
jgi:AraC-like DNA-binding protein